jgi:hypothetical protein
MNGAFSAIPFKVLPGRVFGWERKIALREARRDGFPTLKQTLAGLSALPTHHHPFLCLVLNPFPKLGHHLLL